MKNSSLKHFSLSPIFKWGSTFTLVAVLSLTSISSFAAGGRSLTLRMGPPGVGTGGTNPVGIPPGPTDIELGYVTSSKWEFSAAAVPGLLLGKRFDFKGAYMGAGGGLIISANGVGIGPYTSFGFELGSGTLRFNMEYKQAIGITQSGLVSPYAVRAGVAWY